ncbi:hypothetical protein ACSSS7_004186 [Eimeria intestinalis]
MTIRRKEASGLLQGLLLLLLLLFGFFVVTSAAAGVWALAAAADAGVAAAGAVAAAVVAAAAVAAAALCLTAPVWPLQLLLSLGAAVIAAVAGPVPSEGSLGSRVYVFGVQDSTRTILGATCIVLLRDRRFKVFAKSSEAEVLPSFSLSPRFDFNNFTGSRQLKALGALSRAARGFEAKYKGRVGGPLFASALKRFETLQAKAAEIVSFAALAADRNLNDTHKQIARARVENYVLTKVTPHLLFFELEACSLPSEWLSVHLKTSAFVRSRRIYLSQLLRQRRHLLSPEVEVVLETRKPYDAQLAATTILKRELGITRFNSPFLSPSEAPHHQQQQQEQQQGQQQQQEEEEGETAEGKETEAETVSLSAAQGATQHKDAQVRARALEAIDNGIRSRRLDVLASVSLNAVAGLWGVDSRQRGYQSLRSKRNLSFGVPDAAVSALIAAVRLEGPPLAARFYRLKKQILFETQGLERFTFADRLAPVSLSPNEATFSWASAVSLVEASFSSYLPFCTFEFSKLLEEKRIDAAPGKYKRPGNFTRHASPRTGPFVFLSFEGKARDVKALAREATHACILSLRAPLGPLAWSPPPALAETAARIGERIINDRLRAAAKTGLERLDQTETEKEREK